MAGVYKRKYDNGTVRWRVAFKHKGLPSFSKSFADFDEAKEWAEQHEEYYIHNPEKYHKFRQDTRDYLKKLQRKARKP